MNSSMANKSLTFLVVFLLIAAMGAADEDAEIFDDSNDNLKVESQRQMMYSQGQSNAGYARRFIPMPRSGPSGFQYRGTVWQSGWVPVSTIDLSKVGQTRHQDLSSTGISPHEAKRYASKFFPHLKNPYVPERKQQYQQRPIQYGGIGSYYGNPMTVQEVVSRCEPTKCYVGCRKSLLGGGRCTRGGCLCYAAFFNHDGAPTSVIYSEDQIWYSLPEAEQLEIKRIWQSNTPQTTENPNHEEYEPSTRPHYNPTPRPNHGHDHDFEDDSEELPYVPETRPDYNDDDSDWYGGLDDDDTAPEESDTYNPPEETDPWYDDSSSNGDDEDIDDDDWDF